VIGQEQVRSALSQVEDPELGQDIVTLGMVRDIVVAGDKVSFTIALTTAACPMRGQLSEQARQAVASLPGVRHVEVRMTEMSPEEREQLFAALRENRPRPQNRVRHLIAVMSGKGGVGKSTVAALLAVALRRNGKSVGVLDADITGPSIPKMFFARQPRPLASEEGLLPSGTTSGIKIMSINLLLPDENEAVIWRGPLISSAIGQFWAEVVWGDMDYLLVDLPPGTSDASLTVMQSLPLNGVVLVTSPQSLAGMVVRKAASMAQRLNVPLVGVIENMSFARCPHCGETLDLFGPSHAHELACDLETELLGRLPVEPDLATYADSGRIEEYPADEFEAIAQRLLFRLPEEQTELLMGRQRG